MDKLMEPVSLDPSPLTVLPSSKKPNMGLRSDREFRIALYSFFFGAILAFFISNLIVKSSRPRQNRKIELNRREPNKGVGIESKQVINQQCPECPKQAAICPLCPDTPLWIPDTMEEFITNHIVESREGALVIARTRMKSVPSYFLSLHPFERDTQISHQLTSRGDWNEQLIRTACHMMKIAPEGSYFVEVGAYVGALSFGVAQCGYTVAAFEPYIHSFRLLQESMTLNHFHTDQVKLYNTALGNLTGKACLAASSTDRSMARIFTGNCMDDEVEIDKLDRVLKGATIGFLYMDTGGFEPGILAGAYSFLTGPNRPHYIQFRASHSGYSKEVMGTKLDLAQTLQWLEKLGYSLRDELNEPIRNTEQFVQDLGHEVTDVVAIYKKMKGKFPINKAMDYYY